VLFIGLIPVDVEKQHQSESGRERLALPPTRPRALTFPDWASACAASARRHDRTSGCHREIPALPLLRSRIHKIHEIVPWAGQYASTGRSVETSLAHDANSYSAGGNWRGPSGEGSSCGPSHPMSSRWLGRLSDPRDRPPRSFGGTPCNEENRASAPRWSSVPW
jgi:hypothetical protein